MPNHAGNGSPRWMGLGEIHPIVLKHDMDGWISPRPIQREIDPIVLKHDMEGVD